MGERGKIAVVTLRDCTDPETWEPHVDEATEALAGGGLVVLPTDTVYGIAADAFKPEAVQALLEAKGRGRQMPPPVLIGALATLDGLADAIPERVREMVQKHWPGPLTVILQAQPSLQWDLGETHGTVALRMPDHALTLAVLTRTGPLAVSSANTTGSPAATTAAAAQEMLGESVQVYLDGGTSPGGVASTIVDATGSELRIVREGALSAADLGIEPPASEGEGGLAQAPVAATGSAETGDATEAERPTETDEPADTADKPADTDKPAEASLAEDVVIKPRRVRRADIPGPRVKVATGDVAIAPRRVRRTPEPAAPSEPAALSETTETVEETPETPTP